MKRSLIAIAVSSVALHGCVSDSDNSTTENALPQLSPAEGVTLTSQCESYADSLAFDNLTVQSVTTVAKGVLQQAGQDIDEHCLVQGEMFPRTSEVDGQSYAIGFEMRMPKDWNGRFMYQANGGLDGSVTTALGFAGGGATTGALMQGFAVISSNAGHPSPSPSFGIDPQARLDYGYQAVAKLTPMAKSVVKQVYGKEPDRSYFIGCSNGGRHAMVAASRYADQYDGFLVGAPGYRLPLAATASIGGAQAYLTVPDTDPNDLTTAFTKEERQMVSQKLLEKCDALDGLEDGMVQDYKSCQTQFSLQDDIPTCTAGRDGSCLSTEQKTAIESIYSGVTTSTGERIYSTFPYDRSIDSDDHIWWETFAPLNLDSGSVSKIFTTPPNTESLATFDGPEYSRTANLDDLVAGVSATTDLYTESALSFMTPPDPTHLDTLRDRGGKIMVWHGVSDGIFSIDDTQAWYDQLNQNNQGQAGEFAEFFPIPGMSHCFRGASTDQFDMLTPLVNWVEQGQKPESVVATARGASNPGGANAELPTSWPDGRTRPLCPYPSVATYDGVGDPESAASFSCKL